MPTFLYQIKPLPHPLFASIHPLTQRKNMSLIKAPPPPHFWMLDIRRITVNGEPLFSDNQWEPVGYTGRRTQVPRETSENPGGVPPSPCKSGRFQGKTAFVSLSSSWIPATHFLKVRYTCTLYSDMEGSIYEKKDLTFWPQGRRVLN